MDLDQIRPCCVKIREFIKFVRLRARLRELEAVPDCSGKFKLRSGDSVDEFIRIDGKVLDKSLTKGETVDEWRVDERIMRKYCNSLTSYTRMVTHPVAVGNVVIGGGNPVRIQSMTNTNTNDTEASVAQVQRIAKAGGEIVRLTAQGRREAANLAAIHRRLREEGCSVPLVADIHFVPEAALVAVSNVEKVRINPGNFNDRGGQFDRLLALCRDRGTALRIGVNHGSLSAVMMERYGDTPEGMVTSAVEYLALCRERGFDSVVVSLKSSNVRVMVQAYRMLAAEMRERGWNYPLHLGVTEAGDDMEGRIKSSVGIGALLADGLGDTIRVSLTEAPEREIPVARWLVDHFATRGKHAPIPDVDESFYSPYEYHRRQSERVAGIGGDRPPIIWSELPAVLREKVFYADIHSIEEVPDGRIVVLTTANDNGVAEQRAFFLCMERLGKRNPVIVKRSYQERSLEALQVKAAADTGMLFLDGYGDGLWIENEVPDEGCDGFGVGVRGPGSLDAEITSEQIDALSLAILQAARVRISKAEYIACPSCGRTLYDLEETLEAIKERTSHLVGVKIGVMGCIVNGPGEMADADYGYVGAGPGRITLYRGREVVQRNIPQDKALDELENLIRADGKWREP